MNTKRTWRRAASTALIVSLVTTTPLVAQRGRGGGGNYDTTTETSLSGTVDQVLEVPGPSGGPGGVHLMLLSEGAMSEVHLGPATYVSSQGFAFRVGDEVTVTGSRVKLGEADALIAREVRKDDQVLTLRDERGVPRWSGRGSRPPS